MCHILERQVMIILCEKSFFCLDAKNVESPGYDE